jgi:hypothetical protein
LSDESFREFQKVLMENPEAGDVIEGTGGLRKNAMQMKNAAKASVADSG